MDSIRFVFILRRSPLSVWVCVFSIVSHVSSVKTTDFVAKTTDVAKMTDFWRRRRIFYFFFVFAKNPSSLPHCSPCVHHMLQCLHCILMSEAPTLSMCGHTNEGIPSTEHVHMLHWACADIIMRGNPLTDMTDNTEDANPNRQCLHTRLFLSTLWVVLEFMSFFSARETKNSNVPRYPGLRRCSTLPCIEIFFTDTGIIYCAVCRQFEHKSLTFWYYGPHRVPRHAFTHKDSSLIR